MTAAAPLPDMRARPAEEAVRMVALHRLDEAAAALTRLDVPDDPEALHDFRVALRRLRGILRAYRPFVAAAARKPLRRRLRDLATATSSGRDAEVLLEWLHTQRDGLAARERLGWRWLLARLEARRGSAAEALGPLRTDFEKVERRLRRRLGSYQLTVDLTRGAEPVGPSFGEAAAAAARAEADALERRIGELNDSPDDPAAVHAVRIGTKRLRYVLEPVAGGSVVVERLRELQDRLGELCDAAVAMRELAAAVEAAGAERARLLFDRALVATEGPPPRRRDERTGLVALARQARARWDRGLARLEAEWLHGRAEPFLRDAAELAAALESPSSSRRSDATAHAAAADPWTSGPGGAPRHRRRRSRQSPSGG